MSDHEPSRSTSPPISASERVYQVTKVHPHPRKILLSHYKLHTRFHLDYREQSIFSTQIQTLVFYFLQQHVPKVPTAKVRTEHSSSIAILIRLIITRSINPKRSPKPKQSKAKHTLRDCFFRLFAKSVRRPTVLQLDLLDVFRRFSDYRLNLKFLGRLG